MKFSTKDAKSIYSIFSKNLKKNKPYSLLFILFTSIGLLTVVTALFKILASKPDYVYAKVKLSQGLWWAATKRPNYWFIENLKVGEQEKGLTGKPSAELLAYTYYPYYPTRLLDGSLVNPETLYDIYIDIKISAKKTKSGEYLFKRNAIAAGAPIELNFPSVQITGTVIQLSENPPENNLITKILHLEGENINSWEYNAIKVGDSYFDGKNEVFKVIEKSVKGAGEEPEKLNALIKAKILVKETQSGKYFFGEEKELLIGVPFDLVTNNANYSSFKVVKLE